MDDRCLEARLGIFDFSCLSPVREPLLQKLLSMQRLQSQASEQGSPLVNLLTDEELDAVAAAGNPSASGIQGLVLRGGE